MSMPAFELYDIEEKRKYSSEEFQGKPLIITFWVSWCPDCNRDLEAKKVFYEAMDSDRLNMVMIHVPGRESEKGAGLKHYRDNNFPFLSLQDNGQKTYDAYQCMTLPTTVVVDKNGGVEAKFHDKASIQDMMPAVARVMM